LLPFVDTERRTAAAAQPDVGGSVVPSVPRRQRPRSRFSVWWWPRTGHHRRRLRSSETRSDKRVTRSTAVRQLAADRRQVAQPSPRNIGQSVA